VILVLLTELEKFLEEDLGPLDFEITPDLSAKAVVIAREKCIIAGLQEASQIFNYFSLEASTGYKDGDEVKRDEIVFSINGNAKNILRAERLVLNFLG
jgi:nicotinate-nucleotide pyrophosphorylase (carboxylating)